MVGSNLSIYGIGYKNNPLHRSIRHDPYREELRSHPKIDTYYCYQKDLWTDVKEPKIDYDCRVYHHNKYNRETYTNPYSFAIQNKKQTLDDCQRI